jgi:hypothetical protein
VVERAAVRDVEPRENNRVGELRLSRMTEASGTSFALTGGIT